MRYNKDWENREDDMYLIDIGKVELIVNCYWLDIGWGECVGKGYIF